MPWVKFSEPYDWAVPGHNGAVSIHYKAKRYFVKREVAEEAIAKGKAEEVPSPKQAAAAKVEAKAGAKAASAPRAPRKAAAKAKAAKDTNDGLQALARLAAGGGAQAYERELATANYERALSKAQATTTAKLKAKATPRGEGTV